MLKRQLFTILFSLLAFTGYNQITSSPYSIFGMGLAGDNHYSANRGMASTGIALESGNYINSINPASYSGIDSMTFIFEVGFFGRTTSYKYLGDRQSKIDGNLTNVNFGFQINKYWAMGAGVKPFSSVGYSVTNTEQVQGENTYFAKLNEGSGGVNQVYWTNAFSPIKNLSLGVNLSYMFGNIETAETGSNSAGTISYSLVDRYYIRTPYVDFGMQYALEHGKNKYSIGATYGNKTKLSGSTESYFLQDSDSTALEQDESDTHYIPQKVGVGLGYTHGNKYRLGLDYERSFWQDINYSNPQLKTRNSDRIAAGIEFMPSSTYTDKFFKKLYYRFGANYHRSYLVIKSVPINSYALTTGVGFPIRQERSFVNLAFEFGQNGTTTKGLIKESYFMFHFNMTMNKVWFQKRKFY